MNNYIRFSGVLFGVCLISSALLTGVYIGTKPFIEAQETQLQQEALREVFSLPQGAFLEQQKTSSGTPYTIIYDGPDKTKVVGYVMEITRKGYSGDIKIMAGIDTQGVITGVRILSHAETPGLGARCEEVIQDQTVYDVVSGRKGTDEKKAPWFPAQFLGKDAIHINVVKHATSSQEEVQAITGATITSRAITEGLQETAKEILESK